MAQKFANAARASLAAGIIAGDTAVTIVTGGSLFPEIIGPDFARAVLQDANGIEIVLITAHATGSSSFTITRAQEGTTARSFDTGSIFGIRVTAADMVEALDAVDLATDVTGTLPIANGGTGTTSTTFANLTTNVTGTLPVANGGTSLTTLTANNVILGNGASAPLFVSPATAGNVLTANGTTWTSAPVPAGGLTYVYKTANYTAADKEGVLSDTSTGAFTVTLPTTPSVGAQVVVADAGGAWGTNNLTVGRNGSLVAGLAENLVCDISGASVQLVYDGTSWEVYTQVGGNGGTAVTLSGVQTLTNKDLTSVTNTFPPSLVTLTGSQVLTNKTITNIVFDGSKTEEVYVLAGTVIDPTNGTIQTKTLSASTTFTESLVAGQSVTVMIDDGTAYTVTWPATTWKTDNGSAPTLNTTGYTVVVLWKVNSTLYGARVGNA